MLKNLIIILFCKADFFFLLSVFLIAVAKFDYFSAIGICCALGYLKNDNTNNVS